jgi:hypothetical protein
LRGRAVVHYQPTRRNVLTNGVVAPYLRNKAHAQRGAVRRQWST